MILVPEIKFEKAAMLISKASIVYTHPLNNLDQSTITTIRYDFSSP